MNLEAGWQSRGDTLGTLRVQDCRSPGGRAHPGGSLLVPKSFFIDRALAQFRRFPKGS